MIFKYFDVRTQFAVQYCVCLCHLPTHIIPKHHLSNYTIILHNAAIPPQNSYIPNWIIQDNQNVSVHLMITVQKKQEKIF
jgi:hypothetical protein